MVMPIVQFSDLDDFVEELRWGRCECVRVWPASWRVKTGGGSLPLATVWRAVVVQAVLDDEMGKPHSLAMISLALGSYEEAHGSPFGPRADRRKEILERWEGRGLEMVRQWLQERLPLGIRIGRGQVYTGLRGPEVQTAAEEGFREIYEELRDVKEE